MRIGIDLGGTKIAGILLDGSGQRLAHRRVATPRGQYAATVAKVAELSRQLEQIAGEGCSVGVGMPGVISQRTGLVKNANSTCLIGKPLQADLCAALGREVRCANDANCLAVSEGSDGAGRQARVVFAVIMGTGCGAGIAIDGQIHAGPNGVAGEWGHNPLPWPEPAEYPGPSCYCGKRGCVESWISGTALQADHQAVCDQTLSAREIFALAEAGDEQAIASLARHQGRFARALAGVVNVLDPDIVVVGGGLSNQPALFMGLPQLVGGHTFGGEMDTAIVPAQHGDDSGVRGAAWLWPAALPPSEEALLSDRAM